MASKVIQALHPLYTYVEDKDWGALDPHKLLLLLHHLLVTLAQQELGSEMIGCPSNVMILLWSLTEEGLFHPANSITGYCAMLTHGLTAIIIHHVCLLASETSTPSLIPTSPLSYEFTPYCTLSYGEWLAEAAEGDDAFNPTEEVEEPMDQDEVADDLEKELELPAEDLTELDQAAEDLEQSQQLFELLKATKGLDGEPGSDPQRATACSKRSLLESMQSHPIWPCQAHVDGQGLFVHDAQKVPTLITFQALSTQAKAAILCGEEQILATLPGPCQADFKIFKWEELSDQLMLVDSIFHQPQNQPLLQPLHINLFNLLQKDFSLYNSSGSIKQEGARKWLTKHDNILSALMACFILTCGIPLWDFQFQSFKVDHDEVHGHF
ncbi:hypothetical protein J3A83DRAFT_4381332 [Scleroderma citrinum]